MKVTVDYTFPCSQPGISFSPIPSRNPPALFVGRIDSGRGLKRYLYLSTDSSCFFNAVVSLVYQGRLGERLTWERKKFSQEIFTLSILNLSHI